MSTTPTERSRGSRQVWLIAYYATAVVVGVILLTGALPFPIDVVALLALGLGATWIQYRRAGRDTFSSSVSWLAVIAITWLPLAWLLGRFPFD